MATTVVALSWYDWVCVFFDRYGQEFKQLLARDPTDESKYKDHETLLSFYTEDVMRAAEREVRVWRLIVKY